MVFLRRICSWLLTVQFFSPYVGSGPASLKLLLTAPWIICQYRPLNTKVLKLALHLCQINGLPLQHLGHPAHPLLQPGQRLLLVKLPHIEVGVPLTLRHNFEPLGTAEHIVCCRELCLFNKLIKWDQSLSLCLDEVKSWIVKSYHKFALHTMQCNAMQGIVLTIYYSVIPDRGKAEQEAQDEQV